VFSRAGPIGGTLRVPKTYHGAVGSIAKFAAGNVAKLFSYALYPLKKGVGAIRK
jgi:hypothetical protein